MLIAVFRFPTWLWITALITREQIYSKCFHSAANAIGYGTMSLFVLPKEIRLQIWSLVYFSQPLRLVALRTKAHDEAHDESTFCPRYSPTPAPIAVDICRESRVEASYQARKAGHIIRLYQEHCGVASNTPLKITEEFYFRFDTDILYLPLEDAGVKHFDDSPEVGLLRHFRVSVDSNAAVLRTIAVTQVISSGIHDGSLSNTLREFPGLSRIVMVVPDDVERSDTQKSLFVTAAGRIVLQYRLDTSINTWSDSGGTSTIGSIDMDFAKIVKGKLKIVPEARWKDWRA